jgi:hypothetical protein
MTREHITKVLVVILLFLISSCKGVGKSGVADTNSMYMNNLEKTISVSIIQLISNPEQFDGKRVRLIGFVRLELEGDAIYLHREDYNNRLTKNGLWINITKDFDGKGNHKYDQKYVLVEGTFSANNQGHMGLFSGAIENIERFEVWPVINGRVYPQNSDWERNRKDRP